MIPRIEERLPQLFALARDKSARARIMLAEQLVSIFLDDSISLTLKESQQLNALLDELLAAQDPALRHELVQKLADAATNSRPLALQLAQDVASIAASVLRDNAMLTDDDLIKIVRKKGQSHARLIAERREVAEAVADALLTTGDMLVMEAVAKNLGAKLSPKAVTLLSDAARISVSLQAPVVRRPEMTPIVAARLYWWVAADLRQEMAKRFGLGQGALSIQLNETITQKLSRYALEKNNDNLMSEIADWLKERDALSAALLPQTLRMGHFRLFNILLGRLSGLSLDVIDMVTNEAGGRTLATLCRAIGVDKANFVSIFLLARGARPGEQIVHPRELSFALAAFDSMSPAEANKTIYTWQARGNKENQSAQ